MAGFEELLKQIPPPNQPKRHAMGVKPGIGTVQLSYDYNMGLLLVEESHFLIRLHLELIITVKIHFLLSVKVDERFDFIQQLSVVQYIQLKQLCG